MFEPKSFTERRMAIIEAVMHTYLTHRQQEVDPQSNEGMLLEHLFDQWQYRDFELKKYEAIRLLGRPEVTDQTATREWIEAVLRHNLGLLEAFGKGQFNPDPDMAGNDPDRYNEWLAGLENAGQVVRDTRPSEFFRESGMVPGGLPCLKIVDATAGLMHVIVLADIVNIQTLSLNHLPANWDWDRAPEAWRGELFAYLGNMSKETFLRELATAIKVSRSMMWPEAGPVLYIPEGDMIAHSYVKGISSDVGVRYQVAHTIAFEADALPEDVDSNNANVESQSPNLDTGERTQLHVTLDPNDPNPSQTVDDTIAAYARAQSPQE